MKKGIRFTKGLFFIISAFCFTFTKSASSAPQYTFEGDVIVYGGTSAGVVTAIRVAKSGKKVYLVTPEMNLGAMSSSGLGMTDSGRTYSIGGLSREFYERVYKEYQKPENWYAEKQSEFKGKGQG